MAAPSTFTHELDTLYSTTWHNQKKEAIDQIFRARPFWALLNNRGGIKENFEGGTSIRQPLSYGKYTVTSFGRGDSFTAEDPEVVGTAFFPWKYEGTTMKRFWTDDQQNRGKNAIMSMLEAKVDAAKGSLIEGLEDQLLGDGTGNSGKDLDGLAKLVRSAAPTGATQDVVGNIDAYTYTWWRNKYKTSSGSMATYLISDMRNMYNTVSKGGEDVPSVILTEQTPYEAYEAELLEPLQFTSKEMADLGFEDTLTFKGKPIIWSSGFTTGYIYMLNLKYINFVISNFANFDMTEWKPVQNSLDRAAQIVLAGNLTINQRARQIVGTGFTTA
jgi:hypothetical protein